MASNGKLFSSSCARCFSADLIFFVSFQNVCTRFSLPFPLLRTAVRLASLSFMAPHHLRPARTPNTTPDVRFIKKHVWSVSAWTHLHSVILTHRPGEDCVRVDLTHAQRTRRSWSNKRQNRHACEWWRWNMLHMQLHINPHVPDTCLCFMYEKCKAAVCGCDLWANLQTYDHFSALITFKCPANTTLSVLLFSFYSSDCKPCWLTASTSFFSFTLYHWRFNIYLTSNIDCSMRFIQPQSVCVFIKPWRTKRILTKIHITNIILHV